MRHTLLLQLESTRWYACVFGIDDDVLSQLHQFCERENVNAARLSGIGGFRRSTLGYYDVEEKRYRPIEIEEQVEVVSLLGNVTKYEGKPRIHAHCIVSHRDGHTTAGHLLYAAVRPTLEVMLQEVSTDLHRADRPDVGIPLIDL